MLTSCLNSVSESHSRTIQLSPEEIKIPSRYRLDQRLCDAHMSSLQQQQKGISPRMLKALVSRGHPEFSSNRQQDAHEFLLHIINLVEVSEASFWFTNFY